MLSLFSNESGLDRPIWAALTTTQKHLGYGDDLARRYAADVAPFAALASETPEAYASLLQLLSPDDRILLKTCEPIGSIDGFHVTEIGPLHQMVLSDREIKMPDVRDIVQLGADDAIEIQDLVERTKPGPFGARTLEMGAYIGVRVDRRLVAMAGERMRFDGHVEISAVCVDHEHRGKGLARRLVVAVSAKAIAQGATPFLHVLANNTSAIGLYKDIGFDVQRSFFLSAMSPLTDVA